MTSRNLSFAGAALLIVGLFVPVVTFPMIGAINLFNNGSNFVALVLLVLAVLAASLAANNRQRAVFWPASAAALLLLYLFARLQYAIMNMRDAATSSLGENPFAGIAQAAAGAIQLQWGWLVLATGAGLLIYSAVKVAEDEQEQEPLLRIPSDTLGKGVAAVSALLAFGTIAYDAYREGAGPTVHPAGTAANTSSSNDLVDSSTTSADGPSADEAAYIKSNLRLYDLEANYIESMLDGRIPGVNFKIKNNGNRTLNRVQVRVVFNDAQGNAIAEEEYTPVMVSEVSYGSDNTPLRPNYIYQNEPDKFWQAKSVPSEWKEGAATATITDIEFAANG